MAILTIAGGLKIDKESPTNVMLNKSDLISAIPRLTSHPFFKNYEVWKSVTLIYKSSYFPNQIMQLRFDTTNDQVNAHTIQIQAKDNFVLDAQIDRLLIIDKADGSLLFGREELEDANILNQVELEVELLEAPASLVSSSPSSTEAIIPSLDIPLWEAGFKARIYDMDLDSYYGGVYELDSVDSNTNKLIFTTPPILALDLVLQSPNNTKYELRVNDLGQLVTSVTSKPVSEQFRTLRQDSVSDYASLEVDNDGVVSVNLNPSVLLPIKNNYPILETDDITPWRITFSDLGALVLDDSGISLNGKYVRFAFIDEVVLEQMVKYRQQY